MTRWFRHYSGMMRDDKLVRVAVKTRQPVERVVWVWGAMLESACEMQDGGRFDIDADEVAYFLRCEPDDITQIIDGLETAGRIGGCRILRWADRQFESDASRERVRKHRERKAKRACNADETLQGVTVTPQETETDTDTKKEEEKPVGFSDGRDPSMANRFSNRDALIAQARTDLLAMGIAKSDVKPLIGKWLAKTGDNATSVLDAITRARDQCPHDPIAWITARLTKEHANDRNSYADRNNVVAALRRIGERL